MDYAFQCLKKYKPHSIFDLSLVTASIRPSGASYRAQVMEHKPNRNPTPLIDEIFKDSLGYCVYQEQVIDFLQRACGFPGSKADTVRRAIADKDPAKLETMMQDVIDGYCALSDKSRAVAEEEVRAFVQVLRDASGYSFGYNHSVGYSMIGYLCAMLRTYHPCEFIVALLNHAANEEDIANAKSLASQLGIRILPPKYGSSSATYEFNRERREIAKGAADIKYVGTKVASGLFRMAHDGKERSFVDVILDATSGIRDMNKRRLEVLIAVDYFSDFGNVAELSRIHQLVEEFKYGDTKSYKCAKVGEHLRFIEKYASNLKKDGTAGSAYKFPHREAVVAFLREAEQIILSAGIPDVSFKVKAANQKEYLGYIDLVTGREEDRRKLYIMETYELPDRFRGGVWKVKLKTRSIGSGKEASLSINPGLLKQAPIQSGSVILVKDEWVSKDQKGYWVLHRYTVVE